MRVDMAEGIAQAVAAAYPELQVSRVDPCRAGPLGGAAAGNHRTLCAVEPVVVDSSEVCVQEAAPDEIGRKDQVAGQFSLHAHAEVKSVLGVIKRVREI